ncbi:hypothetical protein SARC_09508 [Sphaeroforma arctica JP610]|uniref:JmjC domain-containing protein n=1 Tax=Sphaeroforma arctica JP610 TaxID=667725 RepID=A0A0L0FMS0_9EUKA|nr:hypothetical protein SARC_09508 [Sphaeroforma arctica JP610]KNC78047.1 hypothetical protein SARC_09508 [Sphaeroforma arctica JP610]|eukprot:XP_014151949.1 hypothetical protein SARC_09508 [Sphaeroforma arctica JP610]
MASVYRRYAHRTVPIEIGERYTDAAWAQRLMSVGQFFCDYLTPNALHKGYLAQHNLFDQIPELRADVVIPDYCCLSPTEAHATTASDEDDNNNDDADDTVRLNAWLGPAHTESPLHFDPDHNLFAQVVGSKYLRLFSPQMSSCLYPYADELLANTSQIKSSESVDVDTYPAYVHAEGWEAIVHSGEMLYIPPRWWHYVRSLEPSFSVSFWWG